MFEISEAQPHEMPDVRKIFEEYAKTLGFDLGFQNFDEELATLPGKYAKPKGRILLAKDGNEVAGCVAIRPWSEDIAEMKRLYVKEKYKGQGLGRKLAEQITEYAKIAGYKKIRLDTAADMKAAQGLYESMGFQKIEKYRENPFDDAVYLEKDLR